MKQVLPFPHTPTGLRMRLGIEDDMMRLNRALDALRALAYRAGVAPLFTNEPPPRISPWESRDMLICELAEGVARMNILQRPDKGRFLGDDIHQRAEWLYNDICYQGNALNEAGYLAAHEVPQALATQAKLGDSTIEDMIAYYEQRAGSHTARLHTQHAGLEPKPGMHR